MYGACYSRTARKYLGELVVLSQDLDKDSNMCHTINRLRFAADRPMELSLEFPSVPT